MDLPHSSQFAHAKVALAGLFFGVTEPRKFKVSGRVYSESLALIRKGWWEAVQRKRLGRQRFALGSKGRWGMTNILEPKTAGIPSNPRETGDWGAYLFVFHFCNAFLVWRNKTKHENKKQVDFTCLKTLTICQSVALICIQIVSLMYWRIWCGNYQLIFSVCKNSQSTTRCISARQICILIC